MPDLLEAGQRLRARVLDVGDRVAHLRVRRAFEVRQQVADAAGGQLVRRSHFGAEETDFLDFALDSVVEKPDPGAAPEGAVFDADVVDHAAVGVVIRVEDERRRARDIEQFRVRNPADHGFEQLLHAFAGLAGDAEGLFTRQGEHLLHLFVAEFEVRGGQVDLVDDRDDLQILLEGEVHICDGLRLHALRRVDEQERPLACAEGTRNLIGEVHVSRGVDQIQLVGVAVSCRVLHADRVGFDRDAAFAFEIHPVQQLLLKITLGYRAGQFEQAVGQRRFSVVDMRDDAEISNQFQFCHIVSEVQVSNIRIIVR